MDHLADKIKRMMLPIVIGIFAIIFGVLGFLYVQEWQQQGTLRNTILNSQGSLAAAKQISDEFQIEHDEIVASVPTINNIAQETEFKNEVKRLVREMIDTKMVAGRRLFPSVDVNDTAIFEIKSLDSDTKKIGSTIFREYSFEVELVDITYEEVTSFIEALEDIDNMETLSVVDARITGVGLDFYLKSTFKVTAINSEDE